MAPRTEPVRRPDGSAVVGSTERRPEGARRTAISGMIFTETVKRRRFIGRLEKGTELIHELKELCKRHNIHTADVWATGFLKNVEIEVFHHGEQRYRAVDLGPVAYQLVSFQGNISLYEGDTVVHVHCSLLPDLGSGLTTLAGGRIARAEVIAIEFSVETIDDFALIRGHDNETGFDQWVQITVATDAGTRRGAAAGSAKGGSAVAGEAEAADADGDDEEIELQAGDVLDHPRLGRCEVLQCDGERVTVRMPKGRTGELHLGILRLRLRDGAGATRVYAVEVRARRA